MKEFLFLYPVKYYGDAILGYEGKMNMKTLKERDKAYKGLAEIIDYRYRQNGYRINWLMFSYLKDRLRPLQKFNAPLLINPTDRLLLSGVTRGELRDGEYANPNYVLSQINPNPEELVVAGFHLTDCVDKIAAAAYARGIPTKVDEDLTELYFMAYYSSTPIQLESSPLNITKEDSSYDHARNSRAGRPWRIQI